jgi:hypothetical protein
MLYRWPKKQGQLCGADGDLLLRIGWLAIQRTVRVPSLFS